MTMHAGAGCSLLFPAAGPGWSGITEYYMWNVATPSNYVDITSTFGVRTHLLRIDNDATLSPAAVFVLYRS